ncbi:hypothetical protein PAMA_015464 [Pampus argenteus]
MAAIVSQCSAVEKVAPWTTDSNEGVDDSNRDNDEGDNKVFVPVGGGPLRGRGYTWRWTLCWLPLPVVTHAL